MPTTESDWSEYRRLVLDGLEQQKRDLRELRDMWFEFRSKDVADLRNDISLLKLKTALWACVFGTVASGLVTAAVSALSRLLVP